MLASTTIGLRIRVAALGIALVSLPLLAADKEPPAAPPPVPAQILAARKVFVSNAGVDGSALAILQRARNTRQPYDQLYAAMKSWPRFEMVGAPADADLVFEIRFTVQLSDCGKVGGYQPMLALAILDSKTHFIPWTIAEPVEGAVLAKTWEKNIASATALLTRDLTELVAQPAAAGGE